MKDPVKKRVGEGWSWVWGDWRSPPFPYLEDRPWTPHVVDGKLCFVACDTADIEDTTDHQIFKDAQWCVVWGDKIGSWFDDVTNLSEYKGHPIYLARSRNDDNYEYQVIWDDKASQSFNRQISFLIKDGTVFIRPFSQSGNSDADEVPAEWAPIDGRGSR